MITRPRFRRPDGTVLVIGDEALETMLRFRQTKRLSSEGVRLFCVRALRDGLTTGAAQR